MSIIEMYPPAGIAPFKTFTLESSGREVAPNFAQGGMVIVNDAAKEAELRIGGWRRAAAKAVSGDDLRKVADAAIKPRHPVPASSTADPCRCAMQTCAVPAPLRSCVTTFARGDRPMPKTALDRFFATSVESIIAARHAEAVAPSDTSDLPHVASSLYIGAAGDVALILANDLNDNKSVTFKAVPAGTVLNVQARRVMNTGASATEIVAMWS